MTQSKAKEAYKTQFNAVWESIPALNEDEGPSPRCGHTLTIHGTHQTHNRSNNDDKHGRLLITFGESSLLANREYLDDMYMFDLRTLMYAKVLGSNIRNEHKPFIKNNFNPVEF